MEAVKILRTLTQQQIETKAKRLLAINGYSKKYSFNPYNVKAFVLCNEFGMFGIAIGGHLQEALDNAADNGLLDHMLIDTSDYSSFEELEENEEPCYLGNASEPFDTSYLTISQEICQYS